MLFSFYNHPQPLWVWADRASISPGKLNLHVDVERGVKANIKGKISSPEKRLGKKAKNQSLPDRIEEKDSSSEHGLLLYEHHGCPSISDQGLTLQSHALQMILFGPFYVRTQYHFGSLQIESLQLAPSVERACVLA